MKILIFAGNDSVIGNSFINGFNSIGHIVKQIDYNQYLNRYIKKIDSYSNYLSGFYREKIRQQYLKIIQRNYITDIENFSPNLILVYNDQMVGIETLNHIKKLGIRLAVFLADYPFFLVRRDHIINLLFKADQIFVPDSYWIESLNIIGLKNTHFHIPGYDKGTYFKSKNEDVSSTIISEITYLGSSYNNSWGYKRALFLNQFANLDFRFYGPKNWEKWFNDFPELKKCFSPNQKRLSGEEVNRIINASIIYPIDANPGIINGIHIRVIESIACGTLPLIEYREDIRKVFPNLNVPIIKDYSKAKEVAEYYLSHEFERKDIIESLYSYVNANYLPEHSASLIMDKVFN